MDRRDLIKKGAAAGALAWTTPAILTSMATPAAATSPLCAVPSFVGSATNTGDSQTVTVARPPGLLPGHILVLGIHFEKGSSVNFSPNPPAGWTSILATNQSSDFGMRTIWRRVPANEGTGDLSFPTSTSGKWSVGVSAWAGVDPALGTPGNPSPIDASAGGGANSGNDWTAPSITTNVPCCTVLCFFGNKSTASYTPEASLTHRYHRAGNDTSTMMASFPWETAGSTGDRTATRSGGSSTYWVAQQVAIRAS